MHIDLHIDLPIETGISGTNHATPGNSFPWRASQLAALHCAHRFIAFTAFIAFIAFTAFMAFPFTAFFKSFLSSSPYSHMKRIGCCTNTTACYKQASQRG